MFSHRTREAQRGWTFITAMTIFVSADLQSSQCYKQQDSTLCDLGPSGGRTEMGAAIDAQAD